MPSDAACAFACAARGGECRVATMGLAHAEPVTHCQNDPTTTLSSLNPLENGRLYAFNFGATNKKGRL